MSIIILTINCPNSNSQFQNIVISGQFSFKRIKPIGSINSYR